MGCLLVRCIKWYYSLSKRIRDSIVISITLTGAISTIFSILGISLGDYTELSIWIRIVLVLIILIGVGFLAYFVLGKLFRDSITLSINQTPISISYGDIFNKSDWIVIGCDTHFDTRVDDVVISKKSLHGQLVLQHGKKEEIEEIRNKEGKRLNLHKGEDGLYDFLLGTIIRYDSSVDHHTYLMLAMTKLDSQYEAHTNMADFEHMLMRMWTEIDRVYASNNIAFPLLGAGISRFDDGPKSQENLLKCMLCTLNSSSVSLNSAINIVIYDNSKDIPLYEYKDLFHDISRR
ncbi:macro domain-containing protein [Acutalibacter sp. 1XD8-36]|uniref:macro domain-containing protein n=1 Tax=Acutalibacter sp. 1XD8-36 TaxID=2320852 RepID=UPI0026110B48|nr:macro domain-containing protein [Acutalibacter sp. 1XD8-36]